MDDPAASAPYRDDPCASLRVELIEALDKLQATSVDRATAVNEASAMRAERDAMARQLSDLERSFWRSIGAFALRALAVAVAVASFGALVRGFWYAISVSSPSVEQRVSARDNGRSYLRRLYPTAIQVEVACSSAPLDSQRAWCVALVDGRPMELRCETNRIDGGVECGEFGPLGWR